jgi:hypothetical protein
MSTVRPSELAVFIALCEGMKGVINEGKAESEFAKMAR